METRPKSGQSRPRRLVAAMVAWSLCMLASGLAAAQSAEQIAKSGSSGGAPACSSCHGAQGEGMAVAGFPRLAGLDAAYLMRQLQALADGQRNNPVMSGVAKLLTDADRQSLSAWYATLPAGTNAAAPASVNPVLVAAGANLAQHGDWSRGVPACAQCHGGDGLGVGGTFPAIAGQSSAYIESQLKAWQAGTRHGDPMDLMLGVARKLSAEDISAAATYYASLAPAGTAPGKAKP